MEARRSGKGAPRRGTASATPVRKAHSDTRGSPRRTRRLSDGNEGKSWWLEKRVQTVRLWTKSDDNQQDTPAGIITEVIEKIETQIDELVVQAFKINPSSKQGRKDVESFTRFISEILSSLKPWVPRFQKTLSSPSTKSENQLGPSLKAKTHPSIDENENILAKSPDQTQIKLDTLISPSPLVSWRGDCSVERGRHLFLLTPLPKSSKGKGSSTTIVGLPSLFTNDDLLECEPVINPTPNNPPSNSVLATPSNFTKTNRSLLMMTPCLKGSPPRSCVLLEPIRESSRENNDWEVRKSTPYPRNYSGSQISEASSSSHVSEYMAMKYPELVGIQPERKLGNGKKDVGASLDWFMSPPKTCVLMEPPEEKSLNQLPSTPCVFNQQTNLKSFNQGVFTPLWKEAESTIQGGRRPGENTLKKELWTRFEAASTNEVSFNVSLLKETNQRGFLARLDEVSRNETSKNDLR